LGDGKTGRLYEGDILCFYDKEGEGRGGVVRSNPTDKMRPPEYPMYNSTRHIPLRQIYIYLFYYIIKAKLASHRFTAFSHECGQALFIPFYWENILEDPSLYIKLKFLIKLCW
jgi:hypothetical protein